MNTPTAIVISALLLAGCASSSKTYHPTQLKVVGNFVHNATRTIFPQDIGPLRRVNVTTFDGAQTNIGASYQTGGTLASVYLYPAGVAHASRLLDEYLSSMQSIAEISNQDFEATQGPFTYSRKGYTVVGLDATFGKGDLTDRSLLTIFECGKWFLKFRITSTQSDLSDLEALRDTLIAHFSPIDLVQCSPLRQKPFIIFSPAILDDSLMMYSVWRGSLAHSAWVLHNVDSLQRCAGFPGLYLAEYTASLLAMVDASKQHNTFHNQEFSESINTLRKIVERGYLNEFVMDQYYLLLITPPNLTLDIHGYRNWARDNGIKRGHAGMPWYEIEYEE